MSDQPLIAPTTTAQEDKTTEGQRAINLMWEGTQSQIAKVVIYVGMIINSGVVATLIIMNREISTATVAIITGSLSSINITVGIVIGFYFSRTNHTQIGGTGKKPTDTQKYEGR